MAEKQQDKKKYWFMEPNDCDRCGVVMNVGSTVAYQMKRCRDCKRNPVLRFISKKHVHDHFEAMMQK